MDRRGHGGRHACLICTAPQTQLFMGQFFIDRCTATTEHVQAFCNACLTEKCNDLMYCRRQSAPAVYFALSYLIVVNSIDESIQARLTGFSHSINFDFSQQSTAFEPSENDTCLLGRIQ